VKYAEGEAEICEIKLTFLRDNQGKFLHYACQKLCHVFDVFRAERD